jgi:hypothetical protein
MVHFQVITRLGWCQIDACMLPPIIPARRGREVLRDNRWKRRACVSLGLSTVSCSLTRWRGTGGGQPCWFHADTFAKTSFYIVSLGDTLSHAGTRQPRARLQQSDGMWHSAALTSQEQETCYVRTYVRTATLWYVQLQSSIAMHRSSSTLTGISWNTLDSLLSYLRSILFLANSNVSSQVMFYV